MAAVRIIERDHGLVAVEGPGRRRAAGHNPARVHRHGASVAEVLHYLFGPGEYRDHHRPGVIAAWA
ncbi:hypothetical protein AB0C02_20080 [Micromonospora sp. NPDC048999]|uniref:hypothetical protein n=1 Tax=Micromonospora sp. NPDC048999 TaxID=3155391 RepID=UPI0033E21436